MTGVSRRQVVGMIPGAVFATVVGTASAQSSESKPRDRYACVFRGEGEAERPEPESDDCRWLYVDVKNRELWHTENGSWVLTGPLGVAVENSGSEVLRSATRINFKTNLSATEGSEEGEVVVDSTGGGGGSSNSPLYGDGADGAITYSSDTTITSGRVTRATTFKVETGVTLNYASDVYAHPIFAQDKIVINGTVNISERGSAGGSGGAQGSSGGNGGDAFVVPVGSGGSGGAAGGSGGGDGGRGGSGDEDDGYTYQDRFATAPHSAYDDLYDNDFPLAGAGGGGGGGAAEGAVSEGSGEDGAFPGGGGGGGAMSQTTPDSAGGGGGGRGGGWLMLASPIVEIGGTMIASGGDGVDSRFVCDGLGNCVGSGAGGGGNGGMVVVMTASLTNNGTVDVSGGVGGDPAGLASDTDGGSGGDGADGLFAEVVV